MSCSAPETPGFLEELSDGHRYGPSPGLVPRTQGTFLWPKGSFPWESGFSLVCIIMAQSKVVPRSLGCRVSSRVNAGSLR